MKPEKPILKVFHERLFNLSGHGHMDISAYEKYFDNNLPDHEMTQEEVDKCVAAIEI